MNREKIKVALKKLEQYIESENYKGYDPYDLLKSPLFQLPFFNNNKTIRFYFQQLGKRFPINLRPMFNVPKGYNPVTLGLAIKALTYLSITFPEKKDEYKEKISFLVNELVKLIPDGFSGACWGYDFDWEARGVNIPAYQPTVVATGIITDSLFYFYKFYKDKRALNLCESASNFVLNDLQRTYSEHGFCFSYSPFDHQVVFNASMKAVRLLAQVYSINGNPELKKITAQAVNFIMHFQREDGSWVYSNVLNKRIDNYHTGYVLSCLKEYIDLIGDKNFLPNLVKGFTFYKNNFIEQDGAPKFYHNKKYPVDCTAAAQLIITLLDFDEIGLAEKVSIYMLKNMFDELGYFYFRRFKHYSIKTSFMRWSNAWMFTALSHLIYLRTKNK